MIGLLPRGKKTTKEPFPNGNRLNLQWPARTPWHGHGNQQSCADTRRSAATTPGAAPAPSDLPPHRPDTAPVDNNQPPSSTSDNLQQQACLSAPATNRHPQKRLGNLPVQREDQRPCVVHQRQRDTRHRQQVCAPLAPSTPSQRTGHIPLARFADAERHVLAEKHVDNIPRHLPIRKTSTLDGCARFKHPSCRELFFHIARLDAPCCLIA